MSTTRNQKRRDRWLSFERFLCVLLAVALVILIAVLFMQCSEIDRMQKDRVTSGQGATIVRAENYLPRYFDRSAYDDACARYEIEQGHVIPEQKETAPETVTSGAADARD